MSIFLFEFRAMLKSLLIWTVTIIGVFTFFMGAVYPVFLESLDTVQAVFAGFPPEFAAAFGINIMQLFNYGGYYCFAVGYISLFGAIFAASLALSAFGREKRSKCIDFLLTKPASRPKIFVSKLLACIIALVISNVLFIAVAMILYSSSGDTSTTALTYFYATLTLLPTQLVFLCFGLAYATYARRIRSISGIATAIGFAAFIMTSLSNIIDDELIRFIAPLKYFEPSPLFATASLEIPLIITAVILCVLFTGGAFWKFCKTDCL